MTKIKILKTEKKDPDEKKKVDLELALRELKKIIFNGKFHPNQIRKIHTRLPTTMALKISKYFACSLAAEKALAAESMY